MCCMIMSLLPLKAGNVFERTVSDAKDTSVTEKFAIYYRFDDISFDQEYLGNSETAERIKTYLINSPRIDSITIYAWSSPEGAYRHNVWLAQERAKTAKRFLLQHSPDSMKLDSEKIHISPRAENWPGLITLVEESYKRHDREKVLAILKDDSIGDETRKWKLQQLDGGYTWNYLWRHYMPSLRNATWVCVWAEVIDPMPEVTRMPAKAISSELPLPERTYDMPVEERVPLMALRTNLLVPGLNFGAELPLGNNWSVAADYYYPWFWPSKKNKNCFELLGWSVEGRYWFGKDRTLQERLRGHSVGLNVACGYYDFEKDYRGIQGEFVSPGLDYTYSMAIGQKKRVNLEFTLAVGYIRSWGRTYNVYADYGQLFPEEGTVIWDYFGPTKAAVSLVVPLYRKEGRR